MDKNLPTTIRVSVGSAIHLGLISGTMDAKPTTAYLLTYVKGKCKANCTFCAQARESSSRADLLSRVTWPLFPTGQVTEAIANSWSKGELQRVCVQIVNHSGIFLATLAIIKMIRSVSNVPISVSCMPFSKSEMEKLCKAGAERLGIPLDAVTKELFDDVKGETAGGPYCWEAHLQALRDASEIFGNGRVSTHLMVGLGEVDRDLLEIVQTLTDIGVYPSLFAFTPIRGSKLENTLQPSFRRYHKIQLAHHLITKGISEFERMSFDSDGYLISFGVDGELLREIALSGLPFMTSGCPGCNRPYYNERPGRRIYNYPVIPQPEEAERVVKEILEEQ
ncbi:radical SAM protein [Candidatus Bathyarchaeota archaeon]|nr:radical SAM protein [Candidatus Bathyarchaeota archaeon]